MGFSYESVDGSKVLAYALGPEEELQQFDYLMLRNNELRHVLSPVYSQDDDDRSLRYQVDELQSLRAYCARHLFKYQQLVRIMSSAAEGFEEVCSYMLDDGLVAGSIEHMFLDARLDVRLTYVPLGGFVGGADARRCLLAVLDALELDGRQDANEVQHVSELRAVLADDASFSLDGFKKQLSSLMMQRAVAVGSTSDAPDGTVVFVPGSDTVSEGGVGVDASDGNSSLVQDSSAGQESDVSGFSAGMAIPGVAGEQAGPSGGLWLNSQGSKEANKQKEPKKKRGLFGGRDKQEKPPKPKKDKKPKEKKEKAAKPEKPKKEKGSFWGKGKSNADKTQESAAAGAPVDGGGGFAVPGAERAKEDSSGVASGSKQSIPGDEARSEAVCEGFSSPFETEIYGIDAVAEKYTERSSNERSIQAKSIEPDEEPPHSRMSERRANLKRVSTGEVRAIDANPYVIGRRKSHVNFYVTDRPDVSREHAAIEREGDVFTVHDCGSSNKTRLNGVELEPFRKIVLNNGDRLCLGDEEFIFFLG